VHGDPDLNDAKITRFGPTAMVLPMLERGNYRSVMDFFKTGMNVNVLTSILRILAEKDTRAFALENLCYRLPGGTDAFLEKARKIVPELDNLHMFKGVGGIRPQLCTNGRVFMGGAKIFGNEHDKLIFDITPSPGASVCLRDAYETANYLCPRISARIFQEDFAHQFRS
jgi:malate dehydrogenase (quinone)